MPSSFSELTALIPSIGAVILTAAAVKWLDAWIDAEYPAASIRGGAAYSLLAIMLAAILDARLTAALFTACYIVGMFLNMRLILPSGMPGWLESLLVFTFAGVYCGFVTAFWAVLVIFSVQLIDDLLDYQFDQQQGRCNIVREQGVERTMILFAFCFYISVLIEPFLSVLVFASALIVANAVFRPQKGEELHARTDQV